MKKILSLIVVCLVAVAGNEAGHGGGPITADFNMRGRFILEELKKISFQPILNEKDISLMENVINETVLEATDKVLIDQFGSTVTCLTAQDPVNSLVSRVQINRKLWLEEVKAHTDLNVLVFHEYLWAMKKDDSQYKISSQLRLQETSYQIYRQKELIEKPEIVATDAHWIGMGADDKGNILAVSESISPASQMYLHLYKANQGWQEKQPIPEVKYAKSTTLTVFADGNALLTWIEMPKGEVATHSPWVAWALFYDKKTGWQKAERIGSGITEFCRVQLKTIVTREGPIVLVNNFGSSVSYHFENSTWVERIIPNLAERASPLQIQQMGKYTILFGSNCSLGMPCEKEGKVWIRVYDSKSGWEQEQLLDSSKANITALGIATNESGNAIAVWEQKDRGVIYSSFSITTGWSKASLLTDKNASFPSQFNLVLSNSGRAAAVWKYGHLANDSGTVMSVLEARALSWSEPKPIEEAHVGLFDKSNLTADSWGNVRLVWSTSNDVLWTKVIEPNSLEGNTIALSKSSFKALNFLNLVYKASGETFIFWHQYPPAKSSLLWATRIRPY